MEKSKLFNLNPNKINTRSIGVNTDPCYCSTNENCSKCFQDNLPKYPFCPFFIPFPYPFCNCMMLMHAQNNMNFFKSCKCETFSNTNNCHRCLKNSASSTFDCSCKNSACVFVTKNSSNDVQNSNNVIEKSEENVKSKERSTKKISREENIKNFDLAEEISTEDITKYANEFLENNYRPRYEPRQKNEATFPKDEIEFQNQNISDDKYLINHLLKPDTVRLPPSRVDLEDSGSEENDEKYFEDDDLEVKTVIRSSEYGRNVEQNEPEEERTKISIKSKMSQISQNNRSETSKEQMLMMLTALVSSQYENNNPHLSKLMNHIGTESRNQKFETISENSSELPTARSSSSPRKRLPSKFYSNMSKSSENK